MKKPYLLLELLIALALVTLLAFPLINQPFRLLHKEIASLERTELERLSELYFAKIKERLYRNEIPWEVLAKDKQTPLFEKDKITLAHSKHIFRIKTYLWTKKRTEDDYLIGVNIVFTPKPQGGHTHKEISFFYRLFLKKENKKIP